MEHIIRYRYTYYYNLFINFWLIEDKAILIQLKAKLEQTAKPRENYGKFEAEFYYHLNSTTYITRILRINPLIYEFSFLKIESFCGISKFSDSTSQINEPLETIKVDHLSQQTESRHLEELEHEEGKLLFRRRY